MQEKDFRIERDSMGEMKVPANALYGASTQRAVINFPISNRKMPREFISALGVIKKCAAKVNCELGLLEEKKAEAIMKACEEVIEGKLDDHFVVDVFQTGSGTSTNMNANEVIANRALQILGRKLGDREFIHPNDHVNMGQSSNDVIPTAIHVSSAVLIEKKLMPSFRLCEKVLLEKADQFKDVVKAGRTHLQDAVPVTLGQEFSGFAAQIDHSLDRIRRSQESLHELALGGTAVGTGLNTHPDFARRTIAEISRLTGITFREARNHFEAQGSKDAITELSGQLRTIATSVLKIANDIRWLSCGPRCGLSEIILPEVQPGSSIMPGKINPVILESVMMVCAQVIGNDACIGVCNQHGNFELNTMMPVMAVNIVDSIMLLSNAVENMTTKCIAGLRENSERCREYAEKSLAICTALAPIIGYDKAAQIAKRAYKEDRTIREIVKEEGILSDEEIEKVLNLKNMTKVGIIS